MVENVENLRPELHIDPLAWLEELGQRSIEIVKPGPREGVSSQVAIGPFVRQRKGARIKPQARRRPDRPREYYASIQRATRGDSRRGIVAEARVQVGTVWGPPVPV